MGCGDQNFEGSTRQAMTLQEKHFKKIFFATTGKSWRPDDIFPGRKRKARIITVLH